MEAAPLPVNSLDVVFTNKRKSISIAPFLYDTIEINVTPEPIHIGKECLSYLKVVTN